MTAPTTKPDMTNPTIVLESLKAADSNSYCATAIARSIQTVASAGKKLDARIHATGLALMYRAADHGDCSLVGKLVAAMPKGNRTKALIAWFHAFSNIRIRRDQDGSFAASMLKRTAKDWAEPRLMDADAKPYWSVEEKTTDPKAFDDQRFASMVAAIIKQAQDETSLSPATRAALADLKVINAKLAPAA